MKILGIGVDIIQNKRIKYLIKNENFIKRIFAKNEVLNTKFKYQPTFNNETPIDPYILVNLSLSINAITYMKSTNFFGPPIHHPLNAKSLNL